MSVPRGPALLGLAVVAGVVVAVLVLSNQTGSSAEVVRGGPLARPGNAMSGSLTLNVGQNGSYGTETIENHGKEAAILDRIAFVGLTPGLMTLDPLVMMVRTKPGLPALVGGMTRSFPPPHEGATLHHVAGFRVPPYQGLADTVEIVIGFRPLREGSMSYKALAIHYHVGDTRYVATYPDPFRVCTPFGLPISRCKALETNPNSEGRG
jgi:hypothetical protein